MRRAKEPIRDVASEADQGWIWGSSRGGGGAPLKDRDGKSLTNLKLVLAGDVEPDHSPSKSPNNGDRYDYDDDYAPRTSRRGDFDAYDDDRDFGGGRRRRNGSGRQPRDDYDDYGERDTAPPRRGGGRRRQPNSYHDSRYDDDDYEDSRRPRPQRERDSVPGLNVGGSGSPKKHMSSLRAMNTSEDADERQAKVKKELTYQEELKRQIDEKKRKKEIEEHKEATIKQKELEEYLSVHYKGNVPPHVAKKVRAQKMKLQEKEYDLKIGDGGSSGRDRGQDMDFEGPPKGGRGEQFGGRSPPDRSRSIYDDVEDPPPGRGASGRQPRGGARFNDEANFDDEDLYGPPRAPRGGAGRRSLKWADNADADEEVIGGRGSGRRSMGVNRHRDDDIEADDPYDEPPMAPRGGKGSPQRGGGGSEKWVPQAEYDELSALCDSLLKQQEDMQAELANNAKKNPAGGRTARTVPTARGAATGGARAKSQQQLHRERPKQTGPGTFGSSRPNSIQSTSRQQPSAPTSARGARSARDRGGQAKPTAPAKVAFGRSIVDSKSKKEDDGPIDARQRKLVKAGGAAMGRVMMKANERGAGPRGSPSKPPMAPRGGRGGSDYGESPQAPQGFHKLAAKARAGPVVVTYEDDLDKSDRSRGRTSVELNGDSEYLRIGGEEVDLIR